MESQAEEYLERISSYAKEKSELPVIRRFLSRLGDPDRRFRIFHVAGTNGKGSVCAFLTAALLEDGKRVGTFTSPHLTELRERFAIEGQTVPKEQMEAAFSRVLAVAEPWVLEGNRHPTYFEFLFYMAMALFYDAGVEYAVLETGMGGLKDATNAVEHPLACVITSVSIDHTKYLGNTIGEIAVHKAGIIKPGSPVVYDGSNGEAATVIRDRAAELSCTAQTPFYRLEECREDSILVTVRYGGKERLLTVPFAAPYQAANAALAVAALECSGLALSWETVRDGIGKTVWPARMECIRPGVYLDGAHNEDGVRAFLTAAGALIRKRRPGRVMLLFAVASDKDYRTMLAEIGRELAPDLCLLTQVSSSRALPTEELLRAARESLPDGTKTACFQTPGEALRSLFSEKREDDLIFIAGSLYLAGEVKEVIADDKF